ncbi:9672_t:CDS:10, partial [Dentiscutata erythropus]
STVKEEVDKKQWTAIDFVFKMNHIHLEIFSGDGFQVKSLDEMSLSKFSLNQSNTKFKMMNDGSMEGELCIRSVTLNDTRPNIKNVYREILPAVNKDSSQFTLSFTMTSGIERDIIAIVTFDSPTVILTLDHLFATRNYFMSAFENSSTNNDEQNELIEQNGQSGSQSPSSPTSSNSSIHSQSPMLPPRSIAIQPQQKQTTPTTIFNYRVSVENAEIILLANPHLASTEAVILSAQQLVLAKQGVMSLAVDQIGMFLCRMDQRESTQLRFIDNFNFNMSMDTRSSKPGQQLTNIEVDVGPLILRVSYRDVLLIGSIVNKVSELSSQSTADEPESTEKDEESSDTNALRTFNYDKLGSPKKNNSKGRQYNTQAFLTREVLKATFQGTRLILIGDEHDIPMIDGKCNNFTVTVNDWSSQMSVDATISTYMNYFNLTNSHWEPLVEPWQYSLHNINPESMVIDISSQKRLELNITHIFIETMWTTLSILNHESEHVLSTDRGSKTPYKLRNKTGYNMHIWAISSDDAKDTVVEELNDGHELNWRFDDWRKTRESMNITKNILGIQFDGALWESIKEIPVDREGETLYSLRPKIKNVSHRLVVHVKLEDNIKVVTFRSALVVENRTLLVMELLVVDDHENAMSTVQRIAPGEDYPVPIEVAYNCKLKMRPDGNFGYNWSRESLYWKDFLKPDPITSLSCENFQQEDEDGLFRFQVFARYSKNDPLIKVYPYMTIRLSAPIQVENLLPYDIDFCIRVVYDNKEKHDWANNFLRKGQVTSFHHIELGTLLLSVKVLDTDYDTSEFAIIRAPDRYEYNIDSQLTLTDKEGAFKYSIYSPYVMINKTGLDMVFKSKSLMSFMQSAKFAAGQGWLRKKDQNAAPYMFSYPNEETRYRALLKVGDSEWSKPLSFEAVGTFLEVVVPSATKTEEIHLGVSIQEGHQK